MSSVEAAAPQDLVPDRPADPQAVDASAAAAQAVDAADRGTLRIVTRVVEKIAAAAAAEVEHVGAPPRRIADRLPGTRSDRPAVSAIVDGHLAQLRVSLAVAYPTPVRGVTREVRGHVRATVERLCAMQVRDIDIEVAALRRSPDEYRRVR